MTGSAYDSSAFERFIPEVEFPVRSYKSSAFEAGSLGTVAAFTARLVHSFSEFIANSVDGRVRKGVVPRGGTGSKILASRAGVRGVIWAERALSTDRPVQGLRMDNESRVLPAEGSVRFGVYTGPMTMQMASAFVVPVAWAGAVGR
ncbi:hypothetical protein [Streptomyces olivaceoviridis]|uniref:hypothetical protein n=1 Tax=Streptomyces olivaceoviridis TaxID=1921 RepID=UPI00379C26E5